MAPAARHAAAAAAGAAALLPSAASRCPLLPTSPGARRARRCLGRQRRGMRATAPLRFFYWFDKSQPGMSGWKKRFADRKSVSSEFQATYPNAQELPDAGFSYQRRGREIRMLQERNKAAAQSALLQFNVMVRQKIMPSQETYTSLIAIMARARMELTAYKLFNRMLQQRIEPLPETYQALIDATDARREALLEDVHRALYAAVQQQPRKLIARRRALLNTQRTAAEKYLTILTNESAEQVVSENLQLELRKLAPKAAEEEGHEADSTLATIYVDSLRQAFYGDAWSRAGKSTLTEQQRRTLRPRLLALSEMELRMFLAIHRRLRSGTVEEMVARVLDEVPEGYVFEMLKQRDDYVAAMRQVIEENRQVAGQLELAITESVEPEEEVVEEEPRYTAGHGGGTVKRYRRLKKGKAAKKLGGGEAGAAEGAGEAAGAAQPGAGAQPAPVTVQEGVTLRGGPYEINYVQLARKGQLHSLSLKELKVFEQGERLQELRLGAGGNRAEHIARIELYLFGEVRPETLRGVRLRRMRDFEFLQLHDRPQTDDDRQWQDFLAATPYMFDAETVRFVDGPGGSRTRFKTLWLKHSRRKKLEHMVRRSVRTLSVRNIWRIRTWLRKRAREEHQDPALQHQVLDVHKSELPLAQKYTDPGYWDGVQTAKPAVRRQRLRFAGDERDRAAEERVAMAPLQKLARERLAELRSQQRMPVAALRAPFAPRMQG
eukprot:TRINITY_DN18284_c0_g1_i1.p1 TRINITY_DN18284_c0_g1~~TRINITY_DN18284_c0_g1_i1.p1  ORF type:complete len:741 (+),score=280.33 TRINITY_DN18284_c0_g1_i1:72-2225(+)